MRHTRIEYRKGTNHIAVGNTEEGESRSELDTSLMGLSPGVFEGTIHKGRPVSVNLGYSLLEAYRTQRHVIHGATSHTLH